MSEVAIIWCLCLFGISLFGAIIEIIYKHYYFAGIMIVFTCTFLNLFMQMRIKQHEPASNPVPGANSAMEYPSGAIQEKVKPVSHQERTGPITGDNSKVD